MLSRLTPRTLRLLVLLALLPALLVAEEPQRGRLPDGRAYRTDASGTQLVDYIAELELNVEALNRRVEGLEGEVSVKEAELKRVSAGQSRGGSLMERDLIDTEQRSSRAADNQQLQRASESETRLRRQLDASAEDLEVERQLNARESAELEARMAAMQDELKRKDEEIESLRAKLGQSIDLADALKQRQEMLHKAEAELAAARAQENALTAAAVSAQRPVREPQTRASFSAARSRAVDSVRGSTLTELNKLSALVATRDKLYNEFIKKPRSVTFQPSRLASSQKRDLAALRRMAESAADVHTLSDVRREAGEIKAKVNDDIGLMQRVMS